MAQTPANSNKPLPEAIIQDFLKLEHSKVNLKAEELKLKAKEIEANERLAKTSMEFQFRLEEKAPKQHKETTIVYTLCIGGLVAIFLGFIGYLVINDKEEFVEEFLKWISYLVVSILSFFAGRASKKGSEKKDGEETPSAEVIN
jgi:hypothetical protein